MRRFNRAIRGIAREESKRRVGEFARRGDRTRTNFSSFLGSPRLAHFYLSSYFCFGRKKVKSAGLNIHIEASIGHLAVFISSEIPGRSLNFPSVRRNVTVCIAVEVSSREFRPGVRMRARSEEPRSCNDPHRRPRPYDYLMTEHRTPRANS